MSGSEASAAKARRNVVVTAAIAGLAGLLFGYDTGIIARLGDFEDEAVDDDLAVAIATVLEHRRIRRGAATSDRGSASDNGPHGAVESAWARAARTGILHS